MLSQFVSHEVPDLPVELEIALPGGKAQRHLGRTDSEGFVNFDIPLEPQWDYGTHPVWETVVFHWRAGEEEQCVDAHVLAPGADTGLAVISDIDDTIVETGITGDFRAVLRNWRRILIQMPEERILVPGADVFYNALGGGEALTSGEGHAGETQPATHRPFFYVSSSPWNLFSYLVTYIRGRGLPLGPIALRDWGLNRATFGSASHGAHKRAAIDGILATYPDMKFALIGDDSQGEFYSIAVTNGRQMADTGTKMIHLGKNTRSRIISKGISAGRSDNTYRGLVSIHKKAEKARNFTQCDSLLIGDTCGAHTFPYTEVRNPSAVLEHEASTSKISEDQLFYCRSRGISEEDAVSMIVNGFCKDVFKELPMEFAVEAQKLLTLKLEDSVG